jgi:hypothetical protein
MALEEGGTGMDWKVTPHALEQMAERGVAVDQLETLLAKPKVTVPDTKRLGRRIYSNDVMIAVVDEDDRYVITVGMKGASSGDWETFAAPHGGAAPVAPIVDGKRRKRVKEKGLPIQKSSVLDGVHPGIAEDVRAYLEKHGLDFRAVQVVSPTEVFINPPEDR